MRCSLRTVWCWLERARTLPVVAIDLGRREAAARMPLRGIRLEPAPPFELKTYDTRGRVSALEANRTWVDVRPRLIPPLLTHS